MRSLEGIFIGKYISTMDQALCLMAFSQNITNKVPPFMSNSTILFDSNYGWPPSRQVQLQIGKSW
jgi:hypothetical protein